MVYELERVLRVCNGFLCSMPVTYDGAVLLWQGSTKSYFVCASYFDRKPMKRFWCMVILDDFGRRRITRDA